MGKPTRMLLRLLGSILGISAMGCAPAYGVQPLYGAPEPPSAEYKFSGTVVDTGTQAAIPGISLIFQGQTAVSAADGTWSLDVHGFSCGSDCSLTARDTDGVTNGSYSDLDVAVAPTQVSAGSGANDLGVFEQKNIKVSLVVKP